MSHNRSENVRASGAFVFIEKFAHRQYFNGVLPKIALVRKDKRYYATGTRDFSSYQFSVKDWISITNTNMYILLLEVP